MHSAITGVGFESGIENVLWVWIHAGLDGL
jgi:hypothetical protein